jgi:hypothetical protein
MTGDYALVLLEACPAGQEDQPQIVVAEAQGQWQADRRQYS